MLLKRKKNQINFTYFLPDIQNRDGLLPHLLRKPLIKAARYSVPHEGPVKRWLQEHLLRQWPPTLSSQRRRAEEGNIVTRFPSGSGSTGHARPEAPPSRGKLPAAVGVTPGLL